MLAGEPLTITLDDGPLGIDTEDLSLRRAYAEHLAGAGDGATVVMIDKRLTPELKMEGHARDIIRNVQNLRKESGLDIADRIVLSLVTDAEPLRAAIDHCAAVHSARDAGGCAAERSHVRAAWAVGDEDRRNGDRDRPGAGIGERRAKK